MKKFLIFFVTIIFIVLGFLVTTGDDSVQKSTLKIIVTNPPEGEYYLDLLVNYDEPSCSWLHEENYDSNKVKLLKEFNENGWYTALSRGTRVPMSGELIGTASGTDFFHDFSYSVPNDFKIVILTKDNKIIVSEEIKIKAFNSVVEYDFKNNVVSQESITKLYMSPNYFFQFLFLCFSTLVIEGIILMLFGFSLKKNLKPFILINIATQILLNIALVWIIITQGLIGAVVKYVILEILLILGFEIILFNEYLKEHTLTRRSIFAIVANLISFICGIRVLVALQNLKI